MEHKKILFRLTKDEDGYPPVDVEGIWAKELSDGTFSIDNIPFFTRQVALGDVVDAVQVGDEVFYKSTKQRSGNSLVRVVLLTTFDPCVLRAELKAMGCDTELSHLRSLFAVNVPATVNINEVRKLLDKACAEGDVDYEEPILRQ